MSLKRFNVDLRSARNRLEDKGIPGIVTLEHGEEQGEVVITFVHENLPVPVLIRLVSAHPGSYPDGNNFLLFTDAENIPPAVTNALENLQNFTFGKTVLESLRDLSSVINRALDKSVVDADGDTNMGGVAGADSDSDDLYDRGDSGEEDYDGDEDLIFGLLPLKNKSKAPRVGAKMAPGVLNKIRRDLRKAREAGAKIGILSGVDDDARTHTFSLSIRARKLGISDEALEAWDVDPSDYIVLLFRIDEPYPSMELLLDRAASSFYTDFRFGKCKRSKPSPSSAHKAFETQPRGPGPEKDATAQATGTSADSQPFSKLFISKSMEQFMNEHLIALAKFRLTGCDSWEDANSKILDLFVRYQAPSGTDEASEIVDAKSKGEAQGKSKGKKVALASAESSFAGADEQHTLPTILTWDSFAESVQDISMPLVAMQCALHYFVRCTEYCLRCHRKVKKEFEALKPYVCEDPLCLFQYITMGFGPSIEHEILSQPYVVDLLVTLCYSSIQNLVMDNRATANRHAATVANPQLAYPIREFPTGLRLKVASLPPPPSPSSTWQPLGSRQRENPEAEDTDESNLYSVPIRVVLDFDLQILSVQDQSDIRHVTGNSWVVLRHLPIDGNGQTLPGQKLVHHAYLKYVDGVTNRVEFEMKYQDPSLAAFVRPGAGPQTMDLYQYDFEFDDLDDTGKAKAMTAILTTVPPISHLRDFLTDHPHRRLRSYQGISPSAATLLEWIVASNRSFILQVNRVDDSNAQNIDLLRTIKTRDQEVIPSLSKGYVQFRFAMGNPDKEVRFQRALKELEARTKSQYPTLFAWHGSALQNWHSILRHGLDFKKIANGRSFGNGVYFSPRYATSQTYMQYGGISWPNSALKPSGVIALCEILNSPDKFTSSSPHYVVQQLDWIQCRYLFIQSAAPGSNQMPSSGVQPGATVPKPAIMDELPQDPMRKVVGPHGENLKIPRKALPAARGGKGKSQGLTRSPSKRSHDSDGASDDTDEEDAADLNALFSDDESPQPPTKRLQALVERGQTVSRDSSVDTVTVRQVTTQRPLTPPKQAVMLSKSDFRPGSLDLKSIPQLALPEWADASSSKRLASDIKMMQKVQMTTPLHELGWYIDFANIDNMFQWIVELHTFDPDTPLAKDMKKAGVTSIVLEVRFGRDYPFSPPFVRVIRPQFVPFMNGGGGHVTIGGAICMEMLTSTGWTVATSMESVLVSVKMAMSSPDPRPARLQAGNTSDYSAYEALAAFQRFANRHGWKVPADAAASASQQYSA